MSSPQLKSNSIFSICYSSSVKPNLSQKDIDNLLKETTQLNISNGVCGILLYEDGNFIQVLEGKRDKVSHLFKRIQIDKRHENIQLIYSDHVLFSVFEGYKTGFTSLICTEDYENMRYYLKLLRDLEISSAVTTTVELFIDSALRS